LSRHETELLRLLEDEPTRALILEWLEEGKPALRAEQIEVLGIAARREEGWAEGLTARSSGPGGGARQDAASKIEELEATLTKERAKAKKARDEARAAREEASALVATARKETAAAETATQASTQTVSELQDELRTERAGAERDRERSGREIRKLRKELDRSRAKVDGLKDEVKALRKELAAATAETATKTSSTRPKKAPQTSPVERPPVGPRRPLDVPKGRFADDPATLEAWLTAPGVRLMVDGYNVTKAEGGYGDLELEVQRERLIQELNRLARRTKADSTVVFDGSEVSPGTSRRARTAVKVEYSAADEIADDHIVALIEKIPPYPVVLVTNDRELQGRAGSLGATIATSEQLLALLR
jgi:predicted RNA-binding protein with PIN domain